MEKNFIDPMKLLGSTTIDFQTLIQILLESRGIISSSEKEPTEEEIELMWEKENGENKNV